MVDHPTDQVQRALRTVLPLFLIIMLDVFSWTVIFPLLTFYAKAFSANLFTLGLLNAPVLDRGCDNIDFIVSRNPAYKTRLFKDGLN